MWSGYIGGFQQISAVLYLGNMCFIVQTLPCNINMCVNAPIQTISVIFVNENENGEKRENNEFVNEN